MKLPEDRKDRIQVLALIAIGVIGVTYIVWMFGVAPLREQVNSTRVRVAELKDKIANATRAIKVADRKQRENLNVVSNVALVTSKYVLEDEVGNFLLPAKALISGYANRSGLMMTEIQAQGFVPIPQAEAEADPRTFKKYLVTVNARGVYSNVVKMLSVIEAHNPYVSIAGLRVGARRDDPLAHEISFQIAWPVWADRELQQSFLDSLNAASETQP